MLAKYNRHVGVEWCGGRGGIEGLYAVLVPVLVTTRFVPEKNKDTYINIYIYINIYKMLNS